MIRAVLFALLALGSVAPGVVAQEGPGADASLDAAEAPFPYAEPEEVGLSSEALADLAELVRGWTRDTLIVGAEILVVKDGRAVLHEATGWSDLEAGEPMRKHSIFRLLALTKPFTWTAALMLAEEGRLELKAPVSRWIPSWAHERSGEVTVRQLLTHTAGWEQYGTPRPLESYPSLRAMVDDAGRHGPQHPPGRAYRYSDVHSYALGALVAEVSGVPVERFIEERIVEPLGLDDTHTRFVPDTAWAYRVSSRYQLEEGAWTKVWSPNRPQADPFFRASGGLFSTAMDYARWLEAWMVWADLASGTSDRKPEAGRGGAGGVPRLLSRGTARSALEPDPGPYGYHWEILSEDPLVFGHGGVDGTHAMAIPSRNLIVIYLSQSQGRELRGEWTAAALDAVAPDLELDPPLASVPAEEAGLDVVELTPDERAVYAGRYGPGGGWLRIFEEGGRLRWRLPSAGSPRVTLLPLGDHTFATGRYEADELGEVVLPLQRLRFVVEDGRATALELIHDGEVRVELPRAESADDPEDEADGSDTVHVAPPPEDTSDIRRVVTMIRDGRLYDPAAIYRALDIEPCSDPPSPELEAAAAYLADRFRSVGLEPAGEDGAYVHRYEHGLMRLLPDDTRVRVRGRETSGRLGFDYFLAPAERPVQGEAAYAGVAGETEDVQGADGRILLFDLPGAEPDAPWNGRAASALQLATAAGAAGVVLVLDPAFPRYRINELASAMAQQRVPIPLVGMTESSARALVAEAGAELDSLRDAGQPAPLGDAVLEIGTRRAEVRPTAPNVAAMLPGSDADLKDTYVVLTAHFDHVGVGAPDASGDSIFNGADDNASGTAALLEIAEAFAALPEPPARSVVFLAVSGEEKGLLGTRAYVGDPPSIDLEGVVANVNLDLIGRGPPDIVVATGQQYSSLEHTLRRIVADHPDLGLNVAVDSGQAGRPLLLASDQVPFIEKGIPAVFLSGGAYGVHHTPADEAPLVDHDKAARTARLAFLLAHAIASSREEPTWTEAGWAEVQRMIGGP